jgi:hypothetical protein
MTETMPEKTTEKTCRCGHDRNHPRVSVEADHGVLGYLRLMIGGTPVPKRIRWRCRVCNEVLGESTDYEDRRQHT